jgi:hypothetical protein
VGLIRILSESGAVLLMRMSLLATNSKVFLGVEMATQENNARFVAFKATKKRMA